MIYRKIAISQIGEPVLQQILGSLIVLAESIYVRHWTEFVGGVEPANPQTGFRVCGSGAMQQTVEI